MLIIIIIFIIVIVTFCAHCDSWNFDKSQPNIQRAPSNILETPQQIFPNAFDKYSAESAILYFLPMKVKDSCLIDGSSAHCGSSTFDFCQVTQKYWFLNVDNNICNIEIIIICDQRRKLLFKRQTPSTKFLVGCLPHARNWTPELNYVSTLLSSIKPRRNILQTRIF